MLKIFRPSKSLRSVLYQCQCQFSDDTKASRDPSKTLPENTVATVKTPYDQKEIQTETWRTPWHEKDGRYFESLRTSFKEDSNLPLLKWIQAPIDMSPTGIRNWWARETETHEILLQKYIPERHNILGPELATAHFIVHRGGAVKFHNEDKWIKAVKGEYQLPPHYQKDMYLQGIDCTDMNLYYEGLDNIRGLRNVEWLSLNGCKNMDDFCIDVVSNIFSHSLLYLDLRNCFNITENGIGALYKMRNLKILYLDDLMKDTKYELTALLLQDVLPDLEIKSDVINFEIS